VPCVIYLCVFIAGARGAISPLERGESGRQFKVSAV